METDAGPIPVVKRDLSLRDRVETLGARSGLTRNNYRIAPGLYAIGEPDQNSEVLVTANFKLTFDILRSSINSISAWILVLDSFGVNVWCAAGKGTFSTQELVSRISKSAVEKVVKHKRVILPQLSATGVKARDVKKMCGFIVIFGPIRASDIALFLQNGKKANADMRQVTFTFKDRLILTPIELNIAFKPLIITALAIFIISGISPNIFSLENSLNRGLTALIFLLIGVLSGALITPTFLPFIPFREFAAKGALSGFILAFCVLVLFSVKSNITYFSTSSSLSLLLFSTAISSWFAMNFTGATPFTSPSGVEKEMRRFIPFQASAAILSLILWLYSGF
ncbi:MAG: hypothetical protein HQK68_07290 [Desulfamplus sp.]|nr:hypothetical protein [Desulfamplus sp.]